MSQGAKTGQSAKEARIITLDEERHTRRHEDCEALAAEGPKDATPQRQRRDGRGRSSGPAQGTNGFPDSPEARAELTPRRAYLPGTVKRPHQRLRRLRERPFPQASVGPARCAIGINCSSPDAFVWIDPKDSMSAPRVPATARPLLPAPPLVYGRAGCNALFVQYRLHTAGSGEVRGLQRPLRLAQLVRSLAPSTTLGRFAADRRLSTSPPLPMCPIHLAAATAHHPQQRHRALAQSLCLRLPSRP